MFLIMRSRGQFRLFASASARLTRAVQAMKNGDQNAVKTMFHLLLAPAQQIGLDDKQLARQFEREYGVAMDFANGYDEPDPAEPTEEEIDWAVHLILSFPQNGKGDVT